MPIIVDEVVISVEVVNAPAQGTADPRRSTEDAKKSIVVECVERVLDALRDRERK
jgi:hypothetical protein